MMRSMFSGVSGLRTHQTKMDVIANNISNVNTVGYKASRVTFKEVFTQTISGASAANADVGRGGVNPMQIGLGVNVGSIDKLMTQGAAQRTDNTMDVMIQGDSFLTVSDESGTYFTRAGALYLDEEGNLVMSGSDGLLVQGWMADEVDLTVNPDAVPGSYEVDPQGELGDIKIEGKYEYIEPEVTKRITYSGNLKPEVGAEKVTQVNFYDSLGNNYVMEMTFKYEKDATGAAGWNVIPGDEIYLEGDKDNPIYIGTALPADAKAGSQFIDIKFFSDEASPTPAAAVPATGFPLKFNKDGKFDTGTAAPDTKMIFTVTPPTGFLPDAQFNNITVDFTGLTQFNQTSDASALSDGAKPGALNGTSMGSDGILTGRYSNGKTRPIAQIAVATFENPAGLEKVGNNLFVPTANSGDFNGQSQTVADTGGSFIVGSLEMSNVDLSSEFTEMITTQRGFQANSKVITTSDELLQELVNLKR